MSSVGFASINRNNELLALHLGEEQNTKVFRNRVIE